MALCQFRRRTFCSLCWLVPEMIPIARNCAVCAVVIIIIIAMTMFMVLSSWSKSLWEFTRFIWWMQTERRVAANPQTKPIDLGCESAENWQLSSTSTIAIVIITQPVSWYSFYRPTEGGRLSRPGHCSKGAQPMPKAVYRSGCRDKCNHLWCDSSLGPLTLQSYALTTRLLRPAIVTVVLTDWTLVICYW